MGRVSQCRACLHPRRRELDAALAADTATYTEIAEAFGLSKSSLDRHWQRHLAPTIAEATKAAGGAWQGRRFVAPDQAPAVMVPQLPPDDAERAAALRVKIQRLRMFGGGWGTIDALRAELFDLEAGLGGGT